MLPNEEQLLRHACVYVYVYECGWVHAFICLWVRERRKVWPHLCACVGDCRFVYVRDKKRNVCSLHLCVYVCTHMHVCVQVSMHEHNSQTGVYTSWLLSACMHVCVPTCYIIFILIIKYWAGGSELVIAYEMNEWN